MAHECVPNPASSGFCRARAPFEVGLAPCGVRPLCCRCICRCHHVAKRFASELFRPSLDAPSLADSTDQVVERRSRKQCGQAVFDRLGLVYWPLDEQPLLQAQAYLASVSPAWRTRTAENRPLSCSLVPSRQLIVSNACCDKARASTLTLSTVTVPCGAARQLLGLASGHTASQTTAVPTCCLVVACSHQSGPETTKPRRTCEAKSLISLAPLSRIELSSLT